MSPRHDQSLLDSNAQYGPMNTTVIDTLRFADRLKEAGFEAPRAEGLARALGDELAEQMVTKRDLADALRPIRADIQTLDAKFEARFDALEPRFESIDARFDSNDARFDANDARFDALDTKIDSVHRELTGKFNILVSMMALGFSLLVGLEGYSLVSEHLDDSAANRSAGQQQAATRFPDPSPPPAKAD